MMTVEELVEQNTMLARNQLLLEVDLAECLEELTGVLNQACLQSDGKLDSMALSCYADAMRFLERKNRFTVISFDFAPVFKFIAYLLKSWLSVVGCNLLIHRLPPIFL